MVRRIDAERARWDGNGWQFDNLRLFRWQETAQGRVMVEEQLATMALSGIEDGPATFRRGNREVSEMRYLDAMQWVETLRRAGRDYRAPLIDAYGKIGFAATPLAVCLIAATVGGLLRRNIMLMSLLLSLAIAVVFYVLRLAGGILAENGVVSPEVGAFAAVILFSFDRIGAVADGAHLSRSRALLRRPDRSAQRCPRRSDGARRHGAADAGVHAGSYQWLPEGNVAGRPGRARLPDRVEQHLPPVRAAGHLAYPAGGRPAPIHGLGPRDF